MKTSTELDPISQSEHSSRFRSSSVMALGLAAALSLPGVAVKGVEKLNRIATDRQPGETYPIADVHKVEVPPMTPEELMKQAQNFTPTSAAEPLPEAKGTPVTLNPNAKD